SGAAMFLSAPIVGRLMNKVDLRAMLLFGFITFAAGSWMMTYVTKDFDYWELFIPQILRGVGLMFSMVPVTNLALGTLPPDRVSAVQPDAQSRRRRRTCIAQHVAQCAHGFASCAPA